MRTVCSTALILSLVTASCFAQLAVPHNPEANGYIIRIESGYCMGLSGCGEITVVDSKQIKALGISSKGTSLEVISQSTISRTEWIRLLRSINVKAFTGLPSPNGCPSCADQPQTWITIDFSDGTKKSVDYDPSNSPPVLRHVVGELTAIRRKHIPPIVSTYSVQPGEIPPDIRLKDIPVTRAPRSKNQ